MPHRKKLDLPFTEHRHTISKMVLDLWRVSHELYFPNTQMSDKFDSGLILMAVLIGHAEGKPFNASKLSAYIDMPRPTLMRRLASLEKDGFVVRSNNHYLVGPHPSPTARAERNYRSLRSAISIIQNAAERLSKLDTTDGCRVLGAKRKYSARSEHYRF